MVLSVPTFSGDAMKLLGRVAALTEISEAASIAGSYNNHIRFEMHVRPAIGRNPSDYRLNKYTEIS